MRSATEMDTKHNTIKATDCFMDQQIPSIPGTFVFVVTIKQFQKLLESDKRGVVVKAATLGCIRQVS